ncbi:solute carrier family 52, riboflavin transporter, member 3 [Ditylenchus destructor]|nr:solute carrier family 52, riboflavin transporter, member 3 [Ditylenchus destructor]
MNAAVYIAVVVFASSSWLCKSFIKLSLLTQTLPEAWTLPSYLDVTIQIACALPLLSGVVRKLFPAITLPFKGPLILVLLVFSALCTLLMALFWNNTAKVFGNEHSVVLITITFFMALVNATSNVLFMPYMAAFHSQYLTAYFVGMGFSALVPSATALIQGTMEYECVQRDNTTHQSKPILEPVYGEPRFSINIYNFVMLAWLCLSIVAFILLHWFTHILLRIHKTAQYRHRSTTSTKTADLTHKTSVRNRDPLNNDAASLQDRRHIIMMVCLVVVGSQLNSIVPSIQVFSALPYSLLTYHLALSLSCLVQPIACFVPLWFMPRKLTQIISLTAVTSFTCLIIIILALQSPRPMLQGSFLGSLISITASIVSYALNCYLRTTIISLVREDSADTEKEGRLFWCGVILQGGSLIGALIMFPLVNIAKIFHSVQLCS